MPVGSFSTHWEPVGWIKLLMDAETSLAYQKLVEKKVEEGSVIPLETLLELLKELLLSRMSIHVRRKDLMRSFWKPGGMGWMGENTEGYIEEISQRFENCKMWDFNWKDMRVLMVINQLNSSDKEEACLAERLMESYNASKADKRR